MAMAVTRERLEIKSGIQRGLGRVRFCVSMSGRCGGEKGHPCSMGKVWYGVLVDASSELTAGFRA